MELFWASESSVTMSLKNEYNTKIEPLLWAKDSQNGSKSRSEEVRCYGGNAVDGILSLPGTLEFRENVKSRVNSEKSKNEQKSAFF